MQSPQNTQEKILSIVENTATEVKKLSVNMVYVKNGLAKNSTDIQDLTSILNAFILHTEERFQRVEGKIDSIDVLLNGVNQRVGNLEESTKSLQNQYITKDYLDHKFSSFRADLIDYLHRNYGPPKHFLRTVTS